MESNGEIHDQQKDFQPISAKNQTNIHGEVLIRQLTPV